MGNDDKPFKQPEELPFRRKVTTRQPGIVGAQWWNDGLQEMATPVSRRGALKALMAVGGTVAAGGLVIALASNDSLESSENVEMLDTLQTQLSEGWNFGAPDERLSFPGEVRMPYDPATLDKFVAELSPRQRKLKPFYQPTLFQALTGTGPGSSPEAAELRAELKPIYTAAMDTAFRQGQGLDSLFSPGTEVSAATMVIVDLPGPEAVAFAAGLAQHFEPVFTFDNWPHPRGVVPAHLTLGAVLYYRPLLLRLAGERATASPPVLVLDRNRLLPYTKPQAQFDNRYMARLPPADRLKELGIKHVLYVVPGAGPVQELDDINEDFVSYREAQVDVKAVAASDFQPSPTEPSGMEDMVTGTPVPSESLPEVRRRRFYYGGSQEAHGSFWSDYSWAGGAVAGGLAGAALAKTAGGHRYEPQRRATMFSPPPNSASGALRPRPNGFAKVQVKVAAGTKQILGFAHGSYSSWNRTPTSYSSSSSGYSSYGG